MRRLYLLLLSNGKKALAEASDEFVKTHKLFYNGVPVVKAIRY